MKKVVVAFSGGLDTSYTVMKLAQDGYEVHAACANTGGFSEEQLKTSRTPTDWEPPNTSPLTSLTNTTRNRSNT